jgi:hypothetical protein
LSIGAPIAPSARFYAAENYPQRVLNKPPSPLSSPPTDPPLKKRDEKKPAKAGTHFLEDIQAKASSPRGERRSESGLRSLIQARLRRV